MTTQDLIAGYATYIDAHELGTDAGAPGISIFTGPPYTATTMPGPTTQPSTPICVPVSAG